MITRHPYRAVGAVLAVLGVSLFLAAMIGQFNDGPWGGLPRWLGAAAWFTGLGSALVVIVLSIYLAAAGLRARRSAQ